MVTEHGKVKQSCPAGAPGLEWGEEKGLKRHKGTKVT